MQPFGIFLFFHFFLRRNLCDGDACFICQFHLHPLPAPHAHAAITSNAQDIGIGQDCFVPNTPRTQPCLLHHLLGLGIRAEELTSHLQESGAQAVHNPFELLLGHHTRIHTGILLVRLPI